MLNIFRDGQGLPVNPVTASKVGNFNLSNWCGDSLHGPVFVSRFVESSLIQKIYHKSQLICSIASYLAAITDNTTLCYKCLQIVARQL